MSLAYVLMNAHRRRTITNSIAEMNTNLQRILVQLKVSLCLYIQIDVAASVDRSDTFR